MSENPSKKPTCIGLLSDTHGLLRPQVMPHLSGCDLILHAGDVGNQEILNKLQAMAPVLAVRGNTDTDFWSRTLTLTREIHLEGVKIYLLHDLSKLSIDLREAGISVVVYGHSHKPSLEKRDGILYVNPGSCGPRRFFNPISIAKMTIEGSDIKVHHISLPN